MREFLWSLVLSVYLLSMSPAVLFAEKTEAPVIEFQTYSEKNESFIKASEGGTVKLGKASIYIPPFAL